MKLGSWISVVSSLAFISALALGPVISAQASPAAPLGDPDPRFDETTGKDRSHFPPSPQFDFRHMKLVMEFPNIDVPMFSAVETMTAAPVGTPRSTMRLDAGPGIDLDSVRVTGRTVRTRRMVGSVLIDFDRPVAVGESVDVVIRYTCDIKGNRGVGLTWSKPIPDGSGPTQQNVQLHSQGEAEENRRWFLAHDFPNEKLTTELVVTVEDGFGVCSNGHLVSKEAAASGRVIGPACMIDGKPIEPKPGVGLTTHHWLQDKPHPSYLVSLVVGKLGVVDINPKAAWSDSPRPGLPMSVWTPMGTEEAVKSVFANTPAMVAFYEARFKQPYPWDKYDQLICRDFRWGGMENTSATTLYPAASRGERGDHDDVICHELAHQWFGDLVTCKSWEHLWLNEGWASICEALWAEQEANQAASDNPDSHADARADSRTDVRPTSMPAGIAPATDAGRRAYQKVILGFMRRQRSQNRGFAPQYPAMVSNHYTNADEPIQKADDVYAKGALVLHMLRAGLGDDLFFRGTALYLERYKFKCAETDDFRRCLEEASGQSLERFFDQWALRPGLPRLEIDLDFSEASSELTIAVEQSQKIDRYNPAYIFTLPVFVKFADGTHQYVYISLDRKGVTKTVKLHAKPEQVSIDPNLTVIAGNNVRKPLAWWLNELRDGPTLAAQTRAAQALLDDQNDAAASALTNAVRSDSLDPSIRELILECIAARAALTAAPALERQAAR